MDNIKPWQIILFIVAIGVLGFSVWKFGFGDSLEGQMANAMIMIDVETGQLYEVDIRGKRGVLIPARNPETRDISLLPVFEQDGEWFIYERYRDALDQLEVPLEAIEGPDRAVKVNGEKILKYRS